MECRKVEVHIGIPHDLSMSALRTGILAPIVVLAVLRPGAFATQISVNFTTMMITAVTTATRTPTLTCTWVN